MAHCPSCGAPLPADAPAGLCPACLARGGRSEGSEADPARAEALRVALAARVSDLELFELIGRGGMGFVFRGRQKRLGRDVAVKVLDPELARSAQLAERFAREAQALARLSTRTSWPSTTTGRRASSSTSCSSWWTASTCARS